jgi:hypothetical protein
MHNAKRQIAGLFPRFPDVVVDVGNFRGSPAVIHPSRVSALRIRSAIAEYSAVRLAHQKLFQSFVQMISTAIWLHIGRLLARPTT